MINTPYASTALTDLLYPFGSRYDAIQEELACSPCADHVMTERQANDFELLVTGGFTPLQTFMDADDYLCVMSNKQLTGSGSAVWTLPVVLRVPSYKIASPVKWLRLRDPSSHNVIGAMKIESTFKWSPKLEAAHTLGTTDTSHPWYQELLSWTDSRCVSGPLYAFDLPEHFDFRHLRATTKEVRRALTNVGNPTVIAFQTRNPLHSAHVAMLQAARERVGGNATVLVHPVVGQTKPGDIDTYTRCRTYDAMVSYLGVQNMGLRLLPYAMRMAGPLEAVMHAIIRRNHGATHMIIGRDHAGPGLDSDGKPFYEPFAARDLLTSLAPRIGISPVAFDDMVWNKRAHVFIERSKVDCEDDIETISGTEVRRRLRNGENLPGWLLPPAVEEILTEPSLPENKLGTCVWLTGLSGSGKTTIARALAAQCAEKGWPVTVLDGDQVRETLSKGLGYSREDRDANVLRVAFVASEIVKHHGLVICALISPYESTRKKARDLIGKDRFFEVHVNTPLDVCEQRDAKGLYAKARRGEIKFFTGIDDPYEPSSYPNALADTTFNKPAVIADHILACLRSSGSIRW